MYKLYSKEDAIISYENLKGLYELDKAFGNENQNFYWFKMEEKQKIFAPLLNLKV